MRTLLSSLTLLVMLLLGTPAWSQPLMVSGMPNPTFEACAASNASMHKFAIMYEGETEFATVIDVLGTPNEEGKVSATFIPDLCTSFRVYVVGCNEEGCNPDWQASELYELTPETTTTDGTGTYGADDYAWVIQNIETYGVDAFACILANFGGSAPANPGPPSPCTTAEAMGAPIADAVVEPEPRPPGVDRPPTEEELANQEVCSEKETRRERRKCKQRRRRLLRNQ